MEDGSSPVKLWWVINADHDSDNRWNLWRDSRGNRERMSIHVFMVMNDERRLGAKRTAEL